MMAIETVKLGDVAQFLRGINFKPDDVVPVGTEGTVACMRTKNVQELLDCGDVWGVAEGFVRRPAQMLNRGDILVSSANSWNLVGKCCWIPDLPWRATFGGFVSVLRADPALTEPRFLYWWFSSERTQALLRSFGQKTTNISNLNIERCLNLSMPFPPLPEQIRIAAILDQADVLRVKSRQALAQLDSLTQAIFIDMFGDPVRNPKGWEVKKLKEISKSIVNGTTPNGGSQVYVRDGIVFFRSQNVWKNRLLLDGVAYIDNETHFKMKKSSLQNKDILITKTGRINTENSSLGRAAIFIGKDNSANINGHVYLVRLEKGSIHEFVLYILTTDEYREYIRSVCVGGIDKRQINKEHLEEFPIIFPPLDLQQRFATLVESIEKQKGLYRAQLAELEHLFSSLQYRAFQGEL